MKKLLLLFLLLPFLGFAQLSGDYVIRTTNSDANFKTLTAAVARVNAVGVSGPVTFFLDEDQAVTSQITINKFTGSSTTNTLTIKPNAGKNVTISGNINQGAILAFNNATNVIIDGNNLSSNNMLTIYNKNNFGYGQRAGIQFYNGSSSNKIQNLKVNLEIAGITTGILSVGIFAGGQSLGSNGNNPKNTIENVSFTNVKQAIMVNGEDQNNVDWNILNNKIESTNNDTKAFLGIYILNVANYTVSGNKVNGIRLPPNFNGSTKHSGIYLENANGGVIEKNIVSNVENNIDNGFGYGIYVKGNNNHVNKNSIKDLNSTSTNDGSYGIRSEGNNTTIYRNDIANIFSSKNKNTNGIYVSGDNQLVYNNFINDVKSAGGGGTNSQNGFGIYINDGSIVQLYYNTVVLRTNQNTGVSAALFINGGSHLDIRNNIFANMQTFATRFAIYSNVTNPDDFDYLNYNDYYSTENIGSWGGYTTPPNIKKILADWKSATGKDKNSINVLPVFVSATDLHLQSDTANNALKAGVDISGTGITTDIDGEARDKNKPYMGADEIVCKLPVPAVITTEPTCLASGTATITPYVATNTYIFSPVGPRVGTGGVISDLTPGTNYTVTTNNGSCTSVASGSFTVAARLTTPAVPAVTIAAATCSAAGTATISNYVGGNSYSFVPSGPSVGTGGVISGLTAGTNYTVTMNNGSCTSGVSGSFTVAAQLTIPAVPAVTIAAATCSAAGTATMTNYVATNTYSFVPSGPRVGTGGVISGLTPGTNYTVTMNNGSCTSRASGSFTVAAQLPAIAASVNIASTATTICAGTNVTFTANPTNGGASPAYQWKINGGNVGTNSPTYSSSKLNNGDAVTVVMTPNASPCFSGLPATSNVLTMTVNSLPTAAVTGNNQICKNANAVFTLTGTAGATVTYTINGINQTPVVIDGSGKATVTVSSAVVNQTLNIVSVSNGTCANPAGSSATVTVGADSVYTGIFPNGSWTKGLPNGNGLNAVIEGDYNTSQGNIKACDCTVQSGGVLTVSARTAIEIENNLTNLGKLTVESEGNLIQVNDNPAAANSGAITVLRDIKIGAARNQYNYVGSPVDFIAGQNLKTIYPGIAFALYHNEANNLFGTSSGANIPGRGLAIKEPTTAAVPAGNMEVTAKYIGVPQNGKINFPLANSNTGTNTSLGYNLLGNPYPSNIDLIKLYELNGGNRQTGKASENISATFYLWDNEVNYDIALSQQGSSYDGQAYAIFNVFAGNKGTGTSAAGYLNTKVIGEKIPSQIISVGQGFMTKALAKGYTLVFNNSIRTDAEVTASFLGRTQNQDLEDDRFWLRLIAPAKVTSTIAVVYFDGGSDAFGAEDSESKLGSDDIFSLVENKKIGINGKRAFTISDKVAVGTKHFQAGIYTIAAGKREGVFANGQKIYLKDKQTGIVTNLSEGSYSFEANPGETTGRFEIIYQPDAVLVTDNKVKEGIVVYQDGSDFIITSKNEKMTGVEIYDTSGKLISKMQPNSTKVVIPAERMNNGMYVLKINQNETVTVKKILK